MQDDNKKSPGLQILIVVFFLLLSSGLLAVFVYYSFLLFSAILSGSDIIAFNKGAVYMLGAGLISALLTYFLIYEIIKKNISDSFNKKSKYIGLAFIGSVFLVPQLAEYGVNKYTESIGYMYCPEQSYRWLHAQNLVFTSNREICVNSNKEITKDIEQ